LDGSNNLVIDVSICCDHVNNSTVNNGHLNGKMHTNDYLQARAGIKNNRFKEDYAAAGTAFAPDDDDCFYYHSWRNNVVIAFGTLSSFLT